MITVGSYEAKTHLSQLLDRVAKGEEIMITKRGVPVAVLSSAGKVVKRNVGETIDGLRKFRKNKTLGGVGIRELIEEGRRY
jgi:prevent-host-death family protein